MAALSEGEQSLETQFVELRQIVESQQRRIEELENRAGMHEDPLLEKARQHWITGLVEPMGWWGAALGAGGIFKTGSSLTNADHFIQENIWVIGFMFFGRYGGHIGHRVGVQTALKYERFKEGFNLPLILKAPSLPNLPQSLNRPLLGLKALALLPFSRVPF